MRIDFPSDHRIPQLRQLWKEAFGDTDDFLDLFFSVAYDPSRCRYIETGGPVAAALYWFDLRCDGQKLAYLYAVATAADSRGQGLCRTLMADTAALLKGQGYQGILLVPQDENLRTMYGRMGYLSASTMDEWFCAASEPCPIRKITPEEYANLRSSYLPENSVQPDSKALSFLSALARFYAGDGFCAAVSREEGHLRILEYLGDRSAAPALIAALGATEATLHGPGMQMPFAMYLPLTPECHKPSYYPFAFD